MARRREWLLFGLATLFYAPLIAQIESITICNPAGVGGAGSCPPGTFDTHQIVLAPDGSGKAINLYGGLNATSDEHAGPARTARGSGRSTLPERTDTGRTARVSDRCFCRRPG